MAKLSVSVLLGCLLLGTVVSSQTTNQQLPAGSSVKSARRSPLHNDSTAGRSSSDGNSTLVGSDGWPCLRSGTKPEDVVSAPFPKPGTGRSRGGKVTVAQTLRGMKARCRNGKLVDANGREIYFYRLAGCWGNPPADYQEILKHQNEELARLKKRYHVIEMTCNPSGEQISSIFPRHTSGGRL